MSASVENKLEINLKKLSEMVDHQWSESEISVIKQNVAKGTTMSELALFLNVCKSVGLNPFNREMWCYKDHKGNLLMFAGRDGMLRKAQESPAFAGMRSAEIKANDTFVIDIANNKIHHEVKDINNRGAIIGAYAIVFRKDGEPTISMVEFSRYRKVYASGKKTVWDSHPEDMIKKVAEMKALKAAFGFGSVQIEEDFDIKNGIANPHHEVKRKKLTDEEFKKIMQNTNEWLEQFQDKFDFTGEQFKLVRQRLDE